jgi:hypothetical protein
LESWNVGKLECWKEEDFRPITHPVLTGQATRNPQLVTHNQ